MTTVTFDTYAFIRHLKESGVPEQQAVAQSEAVAKAMEQAISGHMDGLATKGDIKSLELEIEKVRKEIAETKASIIQWMIGLLFAQTGLIIAILKLFPAK